MNYGLYATMSFDSAAREIARVKPLSSNGIDSILNKWGFSLDSLSDDEFNQLVSMVHDYERVMYR